MTKDRSNLVSSPVIKNANLAEIDQINRRIKRLPFEYRALQLSVAQFGEDYDLEWWKDSYESLNPEEMNKVRQVTGGFNEIVNHCTELARIGVTLTGQLPVNRRPHAPSDYRALRKAGGITTQRCSIFIELNRIRNELTHIYIDVEAETAHRAVLLLLGELPSFTKGYVKWLASQGLEI